MPTAVMENKSILKEFHVLALAIVLAGVPLGASAMEPLDEREMASVNGQDGISTSLNGDITTNVWFEDTTGHPDFSHGGFLTLEDLGVDFQLDILVDVAGNGTGNGTGATIIGFDGSTTLSNLNLGVQGSDTLQGVPESADFSRLGNIGDSTPVASADSIVVELNDGFMALGPQAGLFNASGTDPFIVFGGTGEIIVNDARLLDGGSSGNWVGADVISVTNMDFDGFTGDFVPEGLQFSANNTALSSFDLSVEGLGFGVNTAPSQPGFGDIHVSGINLGDTTVTISGKP